MGKQYATIVTLTNKGAIITTFITPTNAVKYMLEIAQEDRKYGWTTTLVATDQFHSQKVDF